MSPAWSIVPFVNNVEMTMQAVADLAAQDVDARVLVIGVGVAPQDREQMDRFAAAYESVLCWWHDPGLPSLSATWNRALRFVWEAGGDRALVANNDIRCTKDTWATLAMVMDEEKAMLVTATGVEEEETLFEEARQSGQTRMALKAQHSLPGTGHWQRGGPGFSLFMISRECHEKYQFDEELIPAFCEDADMHRRMMLGGDGQRIFGTNVRYLHLGGQTLKAMSPERRAQVERQISQVCRAYYARKWGGGVNEERYVYPFNVLPEGGDTVPTWVVAPEQEWTTPALFEEIRKSW